MEIEYSSLWREVESITGQSALPVHYAWSAEIRANGQVVSPLKIVSVDFKQDFEQQYADEIMLIMAISGGVFTRDVYPYKDNLEITLYRQPIFENYDSENPEQQIQVETYTAQLVDTGNPVLDGGAPNTVTKETLDLSNIWNVTFQLVNKALEQVRLVTVGGIWRNCTAQDAITALMTTESRRIHVDDARMPQGVNMIKASNQNKRDHIVIPHGTRLVDVPEYIHKKCGGVYSSGLGYYFKDDWWYVYPCYDTTRFESEQRTLTVVNVPKAKLPQIERSFRKDGNNLVVLATGDIKFLTDADVQQLTRGNGVRFADADKFMNGFVQTKNNKALASRGANNSEAMSVARANGLNNVQVSSKAITANPYLEWSALARRQGGVIAFEWQNSDPAETFPGMMVKLLYQEEDDIMQAYGVLLKAHHYVQTRGVGLTDGRYLCHSMLSVFVKPLDVSTDEEDDN